MANYMNHRLSRRQLLEVGILMPALAGWLTRSPQASGLTAAERAAATETLQRTRNTLLAQLSDLSPGQWRYSPNKDTWSAMQILEHVVEVEESVFTQVKDAPGTRTALAPDRRPRTKDQVIEMVVTNRTTRRLVSPEQYKPTGRWPTSLALVTAFTLQRRSVLDYVTTTADDLRAFAWDNPLIGVIDGYQWLLFIAGHCERHGQQLAELRAMPTFPTR